MAIYFDEKTTRSVSDYVSDPTTIPTIIKEGLSGAFLENAILRDGGSNNGSIVYRKIVKQDLNELLPLNPLKPLDEIPVVNVNQGEEVVKTAIKLGNALRIPYEDIEDGKVGNIEYKIRQLMDAIVSRSTSDFITHLDADINEIAASAAWGSGTDDPVEDVLNAIEEIQGAGYDPDTLIIHPRTLTKLQRNEEVRNAYVGASSLDNPLFVGYHKNELFGLDVAVTRWVAESDVRIVESKTVGFYSDARPLNSTPLFQEGGESGHGGQRESYLLNVQRRRAYGIDNPRAAAIIKGA